MIRHDLASRDGFRQTGAVPRIMTYNVHRCVGTDGKLDVPRIAAVIAAQSPDIVALQEVDVGRARTGGVDQAHALAEQLGMAFHFNAALKVEAELYGDALLTPHPERLVKVGPLPGDPSLPWLEPRGALWVAVELDKVELQVINTHLGLLPREQGRQARALTGPEWLGAPDRQEPMMLVGDFNATVFSGAYRAVSSILREARRSVRDMGAIRTFPSAAPLLAIDHVFVGPGVMVDAVTAPRDALTRAASDHLPLVVDFRLAPPAPGLAPRGPRLPVS